MAASDVAGLAAAYGGFTNASQGWLSNRDDTAARAQLADAAVSLGTAALTVISSNPAI
jgi:hypothetical protein